MVLKTLLKLLWKPQPLLLTSFSVLGLRRSTLQLKAIWRRAKTLVERHVNAQCRLERLCRVLGAHYENAFKLQPQLIRRTSTVSLPAQCL